MSQTEPAPEGSSGSNPKSPRSRSVLLAYSDLKQRSLPPEIVSPFPFPALWRVGLWVRPPLFLDDWLASALYTLPRLAILLGLWIGLASWLNFDMWGTGVVGVGYLLLILPCYAKLLRDWKHTHRVPSWPDYVEALEIASATGTKAPAFSRVRRKPSTLRAQLVKKLPWLGWSAPQFTLLGIALGALVGFLCGLLSGDMEFVLTGLLIGVGAGFLTGAAVSVTFSRERDLLLRRPTPRRSRTTKPDENGPRQNGNN